MRGKNEGKGKKGREREKRGKMKTKVENRKKSEFIFLSPGLNSHGKLSKTFFWGKNMTWLLSYVLLLTKIQKCSQQKFLRTNIHHCMMNPRMRLCQYDLKGL